MSTENYTSDGYPCPYCHKRPLETTAAAPYVRGFLVAYQIGSKTFIGCVPCVKKKKVQEAGLSALVGWFSITALFINPVLIVYNLISQFFVGAKPEKVKKKLAELGLPDNPKFVDIQQIGYALAASMILADGEVDEAEVRAAEKAGDSVFENFDEAGLRMIIQNGKDIPPVEDLASMLADVMEDDAKEKVLRFLVDIAKADGNIAPEEKDMLKKVSDGLRYAPGAALVGG